MRKKVSKKSNNATVDVILHGTWVKQEDDDSRWFLIWGEERLYEPPPRPRGRTLKALRHPYAVSSGYTEEVLYAFSQFLMLEGVKYDILEAEAVLKLPVAGRTPLPSHHFIMDTDEEIKILPCKVDAVCLSALNAISLLSAFPIQAENSLEISDDIACELGADIRFWSGVAKYAFYLISQHKFVPMLQEEKGGDFFAFWDVDLDDPSDAENLKNLIKMMPDSCRAIESALIYITSSKIEQCELPEENPKKLVMDFIKYNVDQWVRNEAGEELISDIPTRIKDKSLVEWLMALTSYTGKFEASGLKNQLKNLCKSIYNWRNPESALSAQSSSFRTCFRLETPEQEEEEKPKTPLWNLRYFLQAVDDPSLLVPADVIWRERKSSLKYMNRKLESPQEIMLGGLGMASRIFKPIEGSLRQARPDSCPLKTEEAYQFLMESSSLLQQSGFGVLAPPWWTGKKSPIKAKIKTKMPKMQGTGILSLDAIIGYDWQLAIGDDTITPEELEQLAKLKVPLVRMRGQWVMLRPEDIQAAAEFFKKHGISGEMKLRDALQLSLNEVPELEGVEVDEIENPEWLDSVISNLKNDSMKQLDQPKEFAGQLRPYQLRGLSWLAFMRQLGLGACLADDMGLGKTVEVIAYLLHDKKIRKSKSRPNLLVCPMSVVGNWQREVERFGPSLKVMLHHGSDRLSGEELAKSIKSSDLVVTSYGLALRDADELGTSDWKGVILDEAQNIKNPSSKTAQAVRNLNAEYKFALTGTPVENRLMELWSIMEFLNPGYLGSQRSFQDNFVLPVERYADEKATNGLKSLVTPFILRRLKTDPKIITDLPEKMEMKVYCNLTKEQVTLYEAVVKDMMEEVEAEEEISAMKRRGNILAGLTKLKQLCNHPALFLHDNSEIDKRSGKLQRMLEMLEETLSRGDRSLIFTQFTEMGEALQKYLSNKLKCDTIFLQGSVSQKKRDKMVSIFQEDPQGPPIFIISIRAGGTGLNLTRANHVFHFDRWWNPAVEDQATDRAFRIGQTRNVQVHKFVCAGTLEEQIDQLIEKKKSLAQSIVGTGENWITEMSNEDLRELITLHRDEALSADER